jgi:hypothetical protein
MAAAAIGSLVTEFIASRSMYTNHWQLNARQAGTRIVRSSVSEIRVCRRPEHESPAKNTCPGSFQKERFSSHCEQGKRRAIFAVFEVKKEILD